MLSIIKCSFGIQKSSQPSLPPKLYAASDIAPDSLVVGGVGIWKVEGIAITSPSVATMTSEP